MIANVATPQNWRNTLDLSVSEGLKNLPEIFSFLTFQILEFMPIQRVQFRGEKTLGVCKCTRETTLPFNLILFSCSIKPCMTQFLSMTYCACDILFFNACTHAYHFHYTLWKWQCKHSIIETRISNYFHYPTTNKTVFCFLRSYDLFNPYFDPTP
jgi:hypothetical protein